MLCRHKERILQTLSQVDDSIGLLQEWSKEIHCVNDYLLSPEGTKNLAASCMLIEAIGEAYKRIDSLTEGSLLPLYPSVPWKAVEGIRDHIAHGYFEVDADVIFETVKYDLDSLKEATRFFIKKIRGQ